MTVDAAVDELPLPLTGENIHLQALAVAMVLESEFGVRLTDSELTPEALGDRRRIAVLLARHGVI